MHFFLTSVLVGYCGLVGFDGVSELCVPISGYNYRLGYERIEAVMTLYCFHWLFYDDLVRAFSIMKGLAGQCLGDISYTYYCFIGYHFSNC